MSEVTDSRGGFDRRTKTYRQLAELTPSPDKLFNETLDGVKYQYQIEPQCRVCRAPDEVHSLVDSLLLYGRTYASIERRIADVMDDWDPLDKISYWSIRNHQKRHLNFDAVAVREIAERRAAEAGRTILEGSRGLVTAYGLLELIMQRGWEDLANGTARPTVSEAMTAALSLEKLETADDREEDSAWVQLEMLVTAIKENTSPDQRRAIMKQLSAAREDLGVPIDVVEVTPDE